MENKPVPTELLDLYANMGFAHKDLEEWEGHTRTVRSVKVAVEYIINILEGVKMDFVKRENMTAAATISGKINELKQLITS